MEGNLANRATETNNLARINFFFFPHGNVSVYQKGGMEEAPTSYSNCNS